jgi:hypothetical protein
LGSTAKKEFYDEYLIATSPKRHRRSSLETNGPFPEGGEATKPDVPWKLLGPARGREFAEIQPVGSNFAPKVINPQVRNDDFQRPGNAGS